MKIRYLLPFLFFLNTQAQFKTESNLNIFDVKSKYIDVAVRDTFGLKDLVNIKGIVKLKYDNNSIYFNRNGLLNHHSGGNLDLNWLKIYHNQSKQNIQTDNSLIKNSPLGEIITQTRILNDNKIKESGLALNYNDFFISSENATINNKISGQTLVKINEDQNLIPFSFEFNNNNTNVFEMGFQNGFLKYIQNKQDSNKFSNYLAGINYSNLNIRSDLSLYYGKYFSGFFNFNIFDKINVNFIYDRNLKVNLSTSNYSKLNKKDFERTLENKLRLVPRVYDSNLETERHYLEDMFFTEDYDFSIDKDDTKVNINLSNLLFHYSENSKKIGLKYKFAIATYDFKQREAKIGLFFE